MFELEDYSSGFHEGYLNKYADSAGPTLDFYVSDSMQDMLDVDIRAEIANVVGSTSEFTSSLDNALEAISAVNSNSANPNTPATTSAAGGAVSTSNGQNANASSTSSSSSGGSNNNAGNSSSSSNTLFSQSSAWHSASTAKWMNSNSSSWTGDYMADLGACVNPISVMPLISSSFVQSSPRINLNSSATSPPPASPIAERDPTKSHLTFSPAQMKVSAGSLRREQVHAHIPKQIVTISSSVTGSTTAPATMATNSLLQRKSSSGVEAVRKDLATELRRAQQQQQHQQQQHQLGGTDESRKNGLLCGATATNTIKLAPGIGGLTFANSATYNKLKQQNAAKSPQGAHVTANGTIVLKRDRDSSPLHNMATLTTCNVSMAGNKRSHMQPANCYTPKSIASSAHSPHLHFNNNGSSSGNVNAGVQSIGSPAASTSSLSSTSTGNASPYNGNYGNGGCLTPLSSTGNLVNIANNANAVAVKPLHQKIKAAPFEPEFPKPAYSYSCLIALALKNSRSGSLPVSEIYSFMCEHFPYFKNAPSGWKNSVRHNLSLNKCFEKIEKPASNGNQRKGCLWAMNPERITKMDEEIHKWSRKDPNAIRNAMVFPDNLELLERGEMKHGSADSDIELDSQSEIEETSDLEEHEFDDTLVDNMLVEEDEEEEEEDIDDDEDLMHGVGTVGSRVHDDTNVAHLPIKHELLTQTQGDFDIEVDEMYDEIEIEDDKQAVRMAIRQANIIEINPSDLHAVRQQQQKQQHQQQQRNHHHQQQSQYIESVGGINVGYHSPKRARLDVNYSIGPAGELEKQIMLPQQQTYKKVIVQPAHNLTTTTMTTTLGGTTTAHHQQHQQQILVQTISSQQQYQPFNTFPQQSRRKMQLVSRIV